MRFINFVIFFFATAAIQLFAQDDHNQIHYNHLAVFAGATSNLEHNSTDFTVGLDYVRRLPFWDNVIGAGVFVESIFAEHKEQLAGIPFVYYSPWHVNLTLAPGIAILEVPSVDTPGHFTKAVKPKLQSESSEGTEIEKYFLFRAGLSYDYHINQFAISPAIMADLIDGHFSIVWGISFGIGF